MPTPAAHWDDLDRDGTLKAFRQAVKRPRRLSNTPDPNLGNNPANSFSASFARSFILLLGVYFKRPSRLFRPTRVDTLASLRQLALESQQSLSASFVRALVKEKGPKTLILSILPPLVLNTCLGALLFESHAILSYWLSKLSFFAPRPRSDGVITNSLSDEDGLEEMPEWKSFGAEHTIMFMESLHKLPHPTIMAMIAGMGAGAIQGVAFTPVENAVRILQRGTTSWLEAFSRVFSYSRSPAPIVQDIGLPKTPQEVKSFLGFGEGFIKAWQGVKWTISRDAVAYGVFFAAFDISRRAGLEVKVIVSERIAAKHNTGQVFVQDADTGNTPKAPTSARIAQAACLVTGGVSASILAEYASRPFRILEEVAKIQKRVALASGLKLTGNPPTSAMTMKSVNAPSEIKTSKLMTEMYRRQGVRGFFQNPAEFHTAHLHPELQKEQARMTANVSKASKANKGLALGRLGWRLVGVAPWGFGFLVYAYLGGEV